jgi:hypothetical protein
VGAALGIGGTLTPALSRRERERRESGFRLRGKRATVAATSESRNGQDGIPARPVAARTAALLVRPHLGCGRTSVSRNGQDGIPARYKDRRPGPCGPGRRRSQSFPIRSRGAWPREAFVHRHHSSPAAQAGSAAQPGSVAQVGSAAQVGSHGTARKSHWLAPVLKTCDGRSAIDATGAPSTSESRLQRLEIAGREERRAAEGMLRRVGLAFRDSPRHDLQAARRKNIAEHLSGCEIASKRREPGTMQCWVTVTTACWVLGEVVASCMRECPHVVRGAIAGIAGVLLAS